MNMPKLTTIGMRRVFNNKRRQTDADQPIDHKVTQKNMIIRNETKTLAIRAYIKKASCSLKIQLITRPINLSSFIRVSNQSDPSLKNQISPDLEKTPVKETPYSRIHYISTKHRI